MVPLARRIPLLPVESLHQNTALERKSPSGTDDGFIHGFPWNFFTCDDSHITLAIAYNAVLPTNGSCVVAMVRFLDLCGAADCAVVVLRVSASDE